VMGSELVRPEGREPLRTATRGSRGAPDRTEGPAPQSSQPGVRDPRTQIPPLRGGEDRRVRLEVFPLNSKTPRYSPRRCADRDFPVRWDDHGH
jgi:hypothetical protein